MKFETTVQFEPTSLKRHRHTRSGRTYDPSVKEKRELLRLLHLPEVKMSNPIHCILKFYAKRPKSHYRTGKYKHLLKTSAPKYNTCRKDIDNMAKFVLDTLNDKLYVDDSQIISLFCEKHYTTEASHIYMSFEEIMDNTAEIESETQTENKVKLKLKLKTTDYASNVPIVSPSKRMECNTPATVIEAHKNAQSNLDTKNEINVSTSES